MALPGEARKYHSVWVSGGAHRPVLVRYAVDGDSLVCFGDGRLAEFADGERVAATIHDLHDGPPLVTFPVTVRELAPEEVELGLFADVVGHRQLTTSYEDARASRRLVALVA